jgi:hypothetical protein
MEPIKTTIYGSAPVAVTIKSQIPKKEANYQPAIFIQLFQIIVISGEVLPQYL